MCALCAWNHMTFVWDFNRGVEELGPEYKLPHCQQMFNIFHPVSGPIYYMHTCSVLGFPVYSSLTQWHIGWSPYCVAHLQQSLFSCHTTRDANGSILVRSHIEASQCHIYINPTELYETVEQVGASMKQYVVEGMRNMWQQLNELARSHRTEQLVVREEEPDTPTSK